jgi:type I restriction enzyme R subunit
MLSESYTVEQLVRDTLQNLGRQFFPASQISSGLSDVFVETKLRHGFIRRHPEIVAQPDRADEVILKLRAILLAVQNDGLVRSNETLTLGGLRGY